MASTDCTTRRCIAIATVTSAAHDRRALAEVCTVQVLLALSLLRSAPTGWMRLLYECRRQLDTGSVEQFATSPVRHQSVTEHFQTETENASLPNWTSSVASVTFLSLWRRHASVISFLHSVGRWSSTAFGVCSRRDKSTEPFSRPRHINERTWQTRHSRRPIEQK